MKYFFRIDTKIISRLKTLTMDSLGHITGCRLTEFSTHMSTHCRSLVEAYLFKNFNELQACEILQRNPNIRFFLWQNTLTEVVGSGLEVLRVIIKDCRNIAGVRVESVSVSRLLVQEFFEMLKNCTNLGTCKLFTAHHGSISYCKGNVLLSVGDAHSDVNCEVQELLIKVRSVERLQFLFVNLLSDCTLALIPRYQPQLRELIIDLRTDIHFSLSALLDVLVKCCCLHFLRIDNSTHISDQHAFTLFLTALPKHIVELNFPGRTRLTTDQIIEIIRANEQLNKFTVSKVGRQTPEEQIVVHKVAAFSMKNKRKLWFH